MANQVPAADIVTNASDAIVAGPGDIIIINSDILISAQGNGFEAIIGTSGAHIEILGQVESTNSNAISLTTNSQISIEVGGSVFSTGSGVLVTDNNNVINHGSITAFHGVNFASTSSGPAEIVAAGETGIGVGVGGVGVRRRCCSGRPLVFQRGATPSASRRAAAAPARMTAVMCGMSACARSSLGSW